MLEYQLLLTRVDNESIVSLLQVTTEVTLWLLCTLVCLHTDVVIRGLRALSFN